MNEKNKFSCLKIKMQNINKHIFNIEHIVDYDITKKT
jgi:hypothetical protein